MGNSSHNKIMINPVINIKICATMPNTIKTSLINAPMILEKILEKRVFKNSIILNDLGYLQLYFFHGDSNVENKRGTEKNSKPNSI